ncbi:olfactory receptor class A-like protein 1 [Spea bombifrons]|uniref:olfactory receptor class A-like protein 1 n=1 Tax=Spea bombifrons TaxID=233779 RepID=UPI002349DF4E|nr:olfactory receptor class A-like protein 1 [Spea bombifrons]
MDVRLLVKAVGFFLLVLIGIPGNMYILLKFAVVRVMEKKLLPANIILMVLSLVNLLIVISRVIPQYLHAIGVENLLDDTKCKVFVYTYRVSRAMSICTTSLLSCHQCILIAPKVKLWASLKQKVTHNIWKIILIILLVNLVLYRTSLMYVHSKKNATTSPYTLHLVYCDTDYLNYINYITNGIVFASRDFLFVGMMAMASSYIVYTLLHHEKSIRGMRSSDKAHGKSVEYKASRAVILLVTLYVLLFGFDNSMWMYTLTLSNVKPDMNDVRIALACSYSAMSPVVIIATNPKLHIKQKFALWSRLLLFNHQRCTEKSIHVECVS